jgi:hypothetical protein
MKNILIASILTIVLVGCSDSEPPVYKSGMTKNEYGEKFGGWLGDKLASSNEADIESYREKSIELVDSFKKKAINIRSSEEAKKLVDNLLADIIAMTENKFKLSKENWIFIANPKVDASASKQSQLEIKYGVNQIVRVLNLGYLPTTVSNVIASVFQDKEDGIIYYKILKESRYSKIIANDDWLKSYEAKEVILETAIKIAENEKLYFDINIDKVQSDKRELKNLEEIPFKHFDSRFLRRSIKTFPETIYEFKKIFDSKVSNDFKVTSTNMLDIRKKELKRAIDSGYKSSVDYSKGNVAYELKKMEEINNEAEIKFEETRRKLIAVLSKASKLRNNDNLSKVQHDIGIFIKTYKILKDEGYEDHTVGKYLSNNRQLYNIKKYDTQKSIELEHTDRMAFSQYMQIMDILLK